MSKTSDHDLLIDLLLRWDELRRQGHEVSAAELCGGRPELAAELERRIQALRSMEAPLGLEDVDTSVVGPPTASRSDGNGTSPPRPTGSAASGTRYRRLRFHARGGLGELFVAHDEELNREVALKEIQGGLARDPICRSRFLFEAEVTAGLEHPGVVPVHGLGQYPDGRPYYAMRLIRGESLKEAIARLHPAGAATAAVAPEGPARDLRALLRRFLDVCDAIAYAHSRGVLHRDLKPANIMLGQYGETSVVDWGLAKRLGRSDLDAGTGGEEGWLRPRSADGSPGTQPGGVSGTPAYMSPEQARGEVDRLGPATDIYSLGATLYCLLTGRAPFEEGSPPTVLERVRCGAFPSPRAVRPGIPPALEAVCLRAMALQPEGRYASVQALSDDLEKWLAGEPVAAYREPWIDRLRCRLSRHRTLVAATVVGVGIATLSLVGIVVLLAGANRRERQLRAEAVGARDRAEEAQDRAVAEKDRAERAQARAVAEAQRAREAARKATMLSDFLVRLFQSSDPLGLEGQGFREPTEGVKDLTAIQLLRRGADRIRGLSDAGGTDGATAAVLMDAIGNALRGLGDYERAQPLLEAAWRARRGSARVDARELADSVFHLGILAHEFLDVAAAEGRYREAIGLYQRAEGAESLAAMTVKFRLAWLLAMERRVAEAEKLFREVLQARQAQLGADHLDVQNVRLALMLVMLERGDRMALLIQAQQLFGRNSLPAGALIAYSRAMASRLAHNYPAAKRQYEDVLITARKQLPARHLLLALLLGDMAGFYRQTGDLARAVELMREALEIGRRTIPLHPLMIDGLTMFAEEMAKHGQIEEAERHYLEAIDLGKRRSRINPSDDRWKLTLDRLVRMEQDRGRAEKAREYRRLLGGEDRSTTEAHPSRR
jgi:serine/threonine protein kinase